MLKYYLEQILSQKKEILTESWEARINYNRDKKCADFFSSNQHVEVGSTEQYFIVNLALSGGRVREDSLHPTMETISLTHTLQEVSAKLKLTPAELFWQIYIVLNTSPGGLFGGWKRLLQLLPNARTERQVTVCIGGISSHLHSHFSPECLQISVTSNVSNPSHLLHHIANSQISSFTVHPFPTPGQTLLW